MPLWGMAIMAAVGVAKSELVDKPKAEKQRKLQAETDRWSPWTGNKGKAPTEADPIGTGMQYGAVGAQAGSAYNKDKSDQALKESIKGYYDRQGNIGAPVGNQAGGPLDSMSSKPGPLPSNVGASPEKKMAGNESAWFFGPDPSPHAQPVQGSGPMPGYVAQDPYASMKDRGMSPVNPESQWSINPYTPAKWGQPGYNDPRNPWGGIS